MEREKKMSIRNFDVIAYLEERNIFYKLRGRNVSEGWVGIQCPFPFCSDPSTHLGINLVSKAVNCWICGGHSLYDLLFFLEGEKKYFPFWKIISEFSSNDFTFIDNIKKCSDFCTYPVGTTEIDFDNPIVKAWMKKRKFVKEDLNEYGLKYTIYGNYKFRMIIPISIGGDVVCWQAMDLLGKSKLKYISSPSESSVTKIHNTLYNYDNVRGDEIIITEGVTDVWRLKGNTVALFTKVISSSQKELLLKKNIKRIKVLLDSDAEKESEKMAKELSAVFDDVILIKLDKGDPADLDEKEIEGIKRI